VQRLFDRLVRRGFAHATDCIHNRARLYHVHSKALYHVIGDEELESPLHPATIGELKWYFENRDKATREPMHPQDERFLEVGAGVFGTPRFTALYQRWLKRGNAGFEGRHHLSSLRR
jgi:hypothetical protein